MNTMGMHIYIYIHGKRKKMASLLAVLIIVLVAPVLIQADDNGRALRPPMGWRSWNYYHCSISQDLMEVLVSP